MGSSHLARSSCTLISRAHSSLHTHGICKPLGAGLHPHSVPLTHTHPFQPLPPFQPCPCTLVLHTHSHTHPCNPSVQRSSQQELAGPRIHTPYSHPPLPYTPIFAQRSCTLTLLAHSTQAQPSAVCKGLRAPTSTPAPFSLFLSHLHARPDTPAFHAHLPLHTRPLAHSPGGSSRSPQRARRETRSCKRPHPHVNPILPCTLALAHSLLHTRSCTPALAHPLLLAHPPTQPKSAREL